LQLVLVPELITGDDFMVKEYIVILHGIFHTRFHMRPLAKYLQKQGYEVLNLNYPSTRYCLEDLIEQTYKNIDSHIIDKTRTVNFVGYSMGGLLLRGILAKYKLEHLGRVVLLGTPNHGSEVADFLKNKWFYKKFFGPAGQQLTTNNKETEKLLGKVNYELGIIAGNFSLDPISSYLIGSDNDGKVSVASTKLEGMKDHVVVRASHVLFPRSKEVQKQVLAFLREGKFDHR
jgi:esterase/lipase